jgi:hypothetical protein
MMRFAGMVVGTLFVCGVVSAADAGLDAGPDASPDVDTDTDVDAGCTFGEADCTSVPWMWCNAANEWVETSCLPVDDFLEYSTCNCDPSDPCVWTEDGYCDEGCLSVVGDGGMFDDTVDCAQFDAGTDTDADVDTDTDTDTDTGDAGPSGGDSDGCGCRTAGARPDRSFLSAIL